MQSAAARPCRQLLPHETPEWLLNDFGKVPASILTEAATTHYPMELLYHYLWKYKMLGRDLHTLDGRDVEILSPGVHNDDAGPDYSNSVVKIGGETWAGNVEIHVKASDWYRHGHDKDAAYDSVVLHVVAVDDAHPPPRRRRGSTPVARGDA